MSRLGRELLCLCAMAFAATPLSAAHADRDSQWEDDSSGSMWLGVGLGSASVNSLAPAPSADRGALAASIELGYRFTPGWGMGLELGSVLPLSGCAELNCGADPADFAPNFSRLHAFGEYRPRASGWRLRAGIGVSRFCYQRYWDANAWSPVDVVLALIDEDYLYHADGGSGMWRCDASRKALGGAVSVGYDWPVSAGSPLSMGLRLAAEAANYSSSPSIGLSKFRHRAVMLTLHLNVH